MRVIADEFSGWVMGVFVWALRVRASVLPGKQGGAWNKEEETSISMILDTMSGDDRGYEWR